MGLTMPHRAWVTAPGLLADCANAGGVPAFKNMFELSNFCEMNSFNLTFFGHRLPPPPHLQIPQNLSTQSPNRQHGLAHVSHFFRQASNYHNLVTHL